MYKNYSILTIFVLLFNFGVFSKQANAQLSSTPVTDNTTIISDERGAEYIVVYGPNGAVAITPRLCGYGLEYIMSDAVIGVWINHTIGKDKKPVKRCVGSVDTNK